MFDNWVKACLHQQNSVLFMRKLLATYLKQDEKSTFTYKTNSLNHRICHVPSLLSLTYTKGLFIICIYMEF